MKLFSRAREPFVISVLKCDESARINEQKYIPSWYNISKRKAYNVVTRVHLLYFHCRSRGSHLCIRGFPPSTRQTRLALYKHRHFAGGNLGGSASFISTADAFRSILVVSARHVGFLGCLAALPGRRGEDGSARREAERVRR